MASPSTAESEAARPVMAMLAVLPTVALAELESALSVELNPTASAAERRLVELHYLASLLEEIRPLPTHMRTEPGGVRGRRRALDLWVPRIPRQIYEERQPTEAPDAPAAALLVIRYRSWVRACRAAYGLRADGRYIGVSNPWQQPLAGKRKPAYTLDDVQSAIRRCIKELGRTPSAGDYHSWARDAKRRARERGAGSTRTESQHPLIPGIAVIYRLQPKAGSTDNRWRAALADVGVTEIEITTARAARLGLAVNATPAKPDTKLMTLPLAAAIEQARAEEVSLDYLAGRAVEPGLAPADGSRFDPLRLLEARDRSGALDERLRQATGLRLGPWRRLLKGQVEPTLGQLTKLAACCGVAVDELISTEPRT